MPELSGAVIAPPPGDGGPDVEAGRGGVTRGEATGSSAPPVARQRRVHYDGYLRLGTSKPDSLLTTAERLTRAAGGYVERLQGTQIILRVPVAGFRALLERLLGLGEVLQRRITARDITDAFQAVELRLRVLHGSRRRLIALLGQARREHEKLSLLGEIKRLTEEIDQLQLQLDALAQLAAYSRITIDAVPRPTAVAANGQPEPGAFRWMATLSPFRRDVASAGHRLELRVPDGMVALGEKPSFWRFWADDPWAAQSPDGVAIWTSLRHNDPRGDARFWHVALTRRLGPRYPAHESYQVGDFRVLELRERGSRQPYRYLVAVRVEGDELQVVEVYFPTAEHQARYGPAIRRVLRLASQKG